MTRSTFVRLTSRYSVLLPFADLSPSLSQQTAKPSNGHEASQPRRRRLAKKQSKQNDRPVVPRRSRPRRRSATRRSDRRRLLARLLLEELQRTFV